MEAMAGAKRSIGKDLTMLDTKYSTTAPKRSLGGGKNVDRNQTTACCPCFREVVNQTTYPIRGYCEGNTPPYFIVGNPPSETGLRVPTVEELRLFCLTGNYRHCPIYHFATEATDSLKP